MVGVAVKVTALPLQMVVLLALMLTAGAAVGLTLMVTGVAVAVGTLGQAAEEVITTVTASPFANALVV